MQNKQRTTIDTKQRVKRAIGKSTYDVAIYFNEGSKESVYDKLRRIIVNDYVNNKKSHTD